MYIIFSILAKKNVEVNVAIIKNVEILPLFLYTFVVSFL